MGLLLEKISKRLVFYCTVAAFGTIIYGWEVGMINILYSMRTSFGLRFGLFEFVPKKGFIETDDKNIRELIITPSFTLGCAIGTFVAYALLDRVGRVKPLIVGGVIFLIGSIIQTCSGAMVTFCIGRIIGGIACGTTMVTAPVYVAEITPKEVRGTMGMATTFGLQLGMLLASFADTISLKLFENDAQWRFAVGCQLIPAVIFIIIVWFIPESPRYLLLKSKDEDALSTVAKIRNKESSNKEVLTEYEEMRKVITVDRTLNKSKWSDLYKNKSIFARVCVAAIMQFLHMMVGVNAIGYYSSQIYEKYLDIELAKWGAWLVTLNNVVILLMSLPAAKYVEKAGRRPLLVWGAFLLALCMFFIFAFCLFLDISGKSAVLAWLCVVCIYLFSIIYGWTWSAAVFVWQSEVFPINLRSKANAVAIFFQYIGSAIVTGGTTTLMKYMKYYTFLIFVMFCFISFVFAFFCIKETKGRSLEEMEELYGGHHEFIKDEEKVNSKKVEELNVKEC